MRFDHDPGLFWLPEVYAKPERAKASDRAPRIMPPIPETGWEPRENFPDLSSAKVIAFDTETNDPDLLEKGPGPRRGAYIAGVSIATDGFANYYPIAHSLGKNLDKGKVFAWLREQLGRAQQIKVGANLLYDMDFLSHEGVEVRGELFDVLYADPLIDEYQMSYSLEAVARRRLGTGKETSLLYEWAADAYGGKVDGRQRGNIWRCPSELVGPYAIEDARLPIQILRAQWPILREKGMLDILRMECRLMPLLLRLRQRGVAIDLKRAQEVDDELSTRIEEAKKEVGINVYAAADLQALCDKEGIEYPRTELGAPSFVKKWLMSHPHPALRAVSQLRTYYKLRNDFIRSAMLGSQIEGRIHCEFNPLRSDDYGTVSGRFSSSHPNLQQIPKRDEYWGPRIRSCFIPEDPDLLWMCNDLSQIEYRLGVHYGCGDGIEEVRAAYRNDRKTDFYALASKITGLPRQESKSISLGTLYGMREKKFALMTGKPLDEAYELFRQFNEGLPFMRATYDAAAKDAELDGFVRTIGGRVCNITPGFEHKALNRKLQGSCADWIKVSMLRAWEAGIFDVLHPYLTVHDELDSGVPRNATGLEAALELHQIMTHAYPLCIPVLAGIDIGRSWGELAEVEPEEFSLAKLQAVK